MPFVIREDINSNHYWGVWEICEEEEYLVQIVRPKEQELKHLYAIKHPKRRLEHLAGRAAAKELIRLMKFENPIICNNELGRPEHFNGPIQVSISHSGKYAAAIASSREIVGIDIQLLKNKLEKVAYRIFSSDELERIKSNHTLIGIYWGVKETLYKLTSKKGINLSENLPIYSHEGTRKGICKAGINLDGIKTKYELHYRVVEDNYVVVFNLPK